MKIPNVSEKTFTRCLAAANVLILAATLFFNWRSHEDRKDWEEQRPWVEQEALAQYGNAQLSYDVTFEYNSEDPERHREELAIENTGPVQAMGIEIAVFARVRVVEEPACRFPWEDIEPRMSSDRTAFQLTVDSLDRGNRIACEFAVSAAYVRYAPDAEDLIEKQDFEIVCDNCNPSQLRVVSTVDFPTPFADLFYVVQPGDTPESISSQLDIPWQDIAQLNDIWGFEMLHPGDLLRIPGLGDQYW